MRVLFVTNMWPDDERPWFGTFIKSQADSLIRQGVSLDVMVIRGGYESARAYTNAARKMAVHRGGHDVIHAHYGHSAVIARLQWQAPLVISYCGDDLLGTPGEDGSMTLRSRALVAGFRQLAHTAAATITKSEEMERCLPPRSRARNHVIPNGVDLDRFAPLPRHEARERLGWSQEERVVLFAGDPAIPRKNFPLADAACRLASERAPDLRLRVVTGVAYDEVPIHMSAADALMLTSVTEGSPNVVKEAMAAALPIVATPVGDVPERLSGVEGCYVREADAVALADAVVAAVGHDRAPAAREAVSALSLERVARRVMGVYETVLDRT